MDSRIKEHRGNVNMLVEEFKSKFSDLFQKFENDLEATNYCSKRANILEGHILQLPKISFEEDFINRNWFYFQDIRLQAMIEYNSYCNDLISKKFK